MIHWIPSLVFFIICVLCIISVESLKDQQVPHIVHEEDDKRKTALIPFCEFGGNISVMGEKIENFVVPFCNSFRPKIIRDQLCYTVDPNEYKHKIDLEGELSLALFINYNEDRQIASENIESIEEKIIVETIGNLASKGNSFKICISIF